MTVHNNAAASRNEDTLEIHDILDFILRRWPWIASGVALALLAATFYIFLSTPIFEIKVSIEKPPDSEIVELNKGRSAMTGLPAYSNDQIFSYFIKNLVSEKSFQKFFREQYLPSLTESQRKKSELYLYKEAKKLFSINTPDGKPRSPLNYQITISADTSEKARKWLLDFLSEMDASVKSELLHDTRSSMEVMVHNADSDLNELRLIAAKKRNDRIIQLEEALHVANAINLHSPQVTLARPPNSDSLGPFIDGSALYARGTKSLSTELALLKKRELDDAFITDLRETESRLKLWKALLEHQPVFSTHRVDGAIIMPADPVAPKRGLVLAIAVIAGLMIGLMVAGIIESFARRGRPTDHQPAS